MSQSTHRSNITDVPRAAGSADLLGVMDYLKALETFIVTAQTPMTIAIQGEWGSGKTSMMNQLRCDLCEGEQASFRGIWINTWQYTLFTDPEKTLVRIIQALLDQVLLELGRGKAVPSESVQKAKKIFAGIARGLAKAGSSSVGMGAVVDEVLAINGPESTAGAPPTVQDLRDALSVAINNYAKENHSRGFQGFLVFVDDLDRIDPVMAVQALELLKNIFDIDHCLFILAIDYDVVVKGLVPKFGEWSMRNEREFRSFFDKIIQLPFSMPVQSYKVETFLVDSLAGIGSFSVEELRDEKLLSTLSMLTNLSIGRNPRSMKRLTNILSLLRIFNAQREAAGESVPEPWERTLNFGLVCLQLAFPRIYSIVSQAPDFKGWTLAKLDQLGLPVLEPTTLERLQREELFDEPWEQVVYGICKADPYLEANVRNISALLNALADQVPSNEDLEEAIERMLALTSVTEVDRGQSGQRGPRKRMEALASEQDWFAFKKANGTSDAVIAGAIAWRDLVVQFAQSRSKQVRIRYTKALYLYVEGKRPLVKMWPQKNALTVVIEGAGDAVGEVSLKGMTLEKSKLGEAIVRSSSSKMGAEIVAASEALQNLLAFALDRSGRD